MGSSSGSSKAGGGAGFLARGEKGQPVQVIDASVMRNARIQADYLQKQLDIAVARNSPDRGGLLENGESVWGSDADAERAISSLTTLAGKMGLQIVHPKSLTGALGNADFAGNRVNILRGMPKMAEANVLAHEVAHHVDFRLRGGWHGEPGDMGQGSGGKQDWNTTHYRKGEHRAQAAASLYLKHHGINASLQTRDYTVSYNRRRHNTGTAAKRERSAVTGIAAHMLSGTPPSLDHTRNH